VGTDPHTFDPTPRDVASVADAQVIFANGAGLEEFLSRMLANAGLDTPVVEVSEGIDVHVSDEHDDAAHAAATEEPESPEADHDHHGVDPHTWTSPTNVVIWVRNIDSALSALVPAHSDEFHANAEAYTKELEAIDSWIAQQIDTIPPENRRLVTDHEAFGYYADRYGLEEIGAVIPGFSTAAQPSAQDLAQIEDTIKKYGVKAVFVGNTANPALSEQIAADTGIHVVPLYAGSLGPAGSGAETYLDYLRYNTEAIVNALK
jgi:ABC-type Zn uptake system ZnuABC Zn-binding protein ZnuA